MKKHPFVSILIVNYNGRYLLIDCLNALKQINYPRNRYEIIIVDNDSQDDSISFIKKNFPEIILVESKTNLGFAGGNNLAYDNARGEYIVLLNNDTRVDKSWLSELVKTAEKKSVGVVSSKLLFDIPFIKLEINSSTEVKSNVYTSSDNYSPLGLIVDDINCSTAEKNYYIWHKRGFYDPVKGNYSSRWTDGHGVVLLPFIEKDKENYQVSLHGLPHAFNSKTGYKIKIADETVHKGKLSSKQVQQLNFEVKKKDVEKSFIYLVQNAGNCLLKSGLGRDRGSVIKRTESEIREFYDYDSSYYQKEKKLLAMCGASCLIKREAVKSKYLFDPAYFMYYEDVDLSLKIWRSGYDIVYQPKSIVYHKHRATTNKEASSFLISHIEKNHLFFLLTHFPFKTFLIQLIISMTKLIVSKIGVFIFEKLHYYGGTYRSYSVRAEGRSMAFSVFKKNFKRIYSIRNKLIKSQKRTFSDLYKELY